MKEQIIHILQTHISAIQLCNDDDPIEIVGINHASEEIMKVIDAEVERRIAERMPTEEEINSKAWYIEGDRNYADDYVNSFIHGCKWFRSRMKGESK